MGGPVLVERVAFHHGGLSGCETFIGLRCIRGHWENAEAQTHEAFEVFGGLQQTDRVALMLMEGGWVMRVVKRGGKESLDGR
jgi:hypothetical protein